MSDNGIVLVTFLVGATIIVVIGFVLMMILTYWLNTKD